MGSIETKTSNAIRRSITVYQSAIAEIAIRNERQVKLSQLVYLLTLEYRGKLEPFSH